MNDLSVIQASVKAPKGQFNNFGKYKYRSCEDIVEAVKPVINQMGFYLTLTDEIVFIGNRFYVRATATISNNQDQTYSATAYAREEEIKKGMDGAQITGAASSYARKYALNGLFAIDDTKDADATNTHDEKVNGSIINTAPPAVAESDKSILRRLLHTADMTPDERQSALSAINNCTDYVMYQKIQHRLEDRQQSFETIVNPSATDVKKHLRKTVKA